MVAGSSRRDELTCNRECSSLTAAIGSFTSTALPSPATLDDDIEWRISSIAKETEPWHAPRTMDSLLRGEISDVRGNWEEAKELLEAEQAASKKKRCDVRRK